MALEIESAHGPIDPFVLLSFAMCERASLNRRNRRRRNGTGGVRRGRGKGMDWQRGIGPPTARPRMAQLDACRAVGQPCVQAPALLGRIHSSHPPRRAASNGPHSHRRLLHKRMRRTPTRWGDESRRHGGRLHFHPNPLHHSAASGVPRFDRRTASGPRRGFGRTRSKLDV